MCVSDWYKRSINFVSVVAGLATALAAGRNNPFYIVLLWPVVTIIVAILLVMFARFYVAPPIERYFPGGGSLGLKD